MSQIEQFQARLAASPGDWMLRAELVEALVLLGNPAEARKLVRDAPDVPVPYDIQRRFWEALAPSAGIVVEEASPGAKPILKAKARTVSPPVPAPSPSLPPAVPLPLFAGPAEPIRLCRQPAPVPAESSTFRLVALEAGHGLVASAPRPRPVPALAAALAVHLLLAFLFSAVVLHSYDHVPAQVTILSPPADEEVEITPEKRPLERETESARPASPSQAGASFFLADAASPLELPSIRNLERNTDANLVDAGIGVSQGLNFEAAGEESNVSFFGIEGGGQCMIFLVEASPHMLLDEKGGMYAYDKVKQEIASLLQTLHRGTAFNVILFDGARLRLFQSRPVKALPSMVQRAIAWLDPVNRDYQSLGLGAHADTGVVQPGAQPILAADISHYAKAFQVALEQKANAVFCITSGWRAMTRSLSPEDQALVAAAQEKRRQEIEAMNLPPARFDPKDVEAWRRAQEKARDWLKAENEARSAKGLPPKVVLDVGALIQKLTPGAAPPRPLDPPVLPPLNTGVQRPPPYSPEEVETHIRNVVLANYGKEKADHPSLNVVLFLGEDESPKRAAATGPYEEHFQNLSRRNKGQLKILYGLAGLQDLTPVR